MAEFISRGSNLRITDLAQTLRYALGCRNMKTATILDSNTDKTQVLYIFSFIFKKS